jgi:hypothetical protein
VADGALPLAVVADGAREVAEELRPPFDMHSLLAANFWGFCEQIEKCQSAL